MTLYDSSVLIGYLAGDEDAVAYVSDHANERAVTIPLVLFEIYQGEVFKRGEADFEAIDGALQWLEIVEETARLARRAAEVQDGLRRQGQPLGARDAFIAGAAVGLGERLAVSDSDFELTGLAEYLSVDFV